MLKFNKIDCEICKQILPFKIAYKNQIVDIVGVEKPEKNYIILESLTANDEKKIFHIIDTRMLTPGGGTEYLKIGRGQDSDVRVTDDISVSRQHAFIHRDQSTGDYFLTDNGAKFGTLLQVQYPIFLPSRPTPAKTNNDSKLKPSDSLVLQSGKSLLKFSAHKPTERYGCMRGLRQCLRAKNTKDMKAEAEVD